MSYTYIKVYNGDAEEYKDSEDNKGNLVEEHSFTDGEEYLAMSFIVGLLDRAKHFDVRHWVN